ncbi:VOC family protein [Enterococcus sp. S23]|nr:VOC family protein [Enterococcus sp. S23]MCA5011370.1 VOC family protein [Enterococcus sp. S23]MCA5015188.1 VOC family protein [Enterococcus sp. S22(2020)]
MSVTIKKASINLFVPKTETAINFYEELFNAKRIELNRSEEGSSARFSIGESLFALADEQPGSEAKSPLTLNGTPFCIQLICDNVDELVEKSLDAGCTLEMPITIVPNKFKVANIKDPFGFIWSISEVYSD